MAGTPEYKGVEISKYAPGTEVVVNAKGEWKLAKVTAQGTLRDKKLSLDVEYPPSGTGSSSTETLVIDGRAPRIISPADVADFEDPDKGTVHVEKKNVAKDGTLEFTIKYDGQSYPGVTEEVFKLWKESASVGERFKQLKTELEHSSARRHLQFVEQNKAAEKMVAEIFTLIRDTKRFNTFDKTQIKERQKKLTELLKDAKKALDTLAHDVAQVDPNQDAEDDKQKREAENVRKILEEGIANGEVKYKEKNRNAAIQKEQEAHAKDKKKYDDWFKAGAVPPARGNPPADPGAFVFSENNIEPVKPEQTAQIKKEVYLSFFENPNKTEFQKKVLREVEKLRKQQAKKDTITDTSEFEKTGTVVSDYKKPADKNVYLTSKYLEVSMKLLDQVLSKIEKNESGTIAEKLEKLHTRAGLLLNEIPKQADKKPHPTYATLHGNIEALHKLIAEDAKNFKSVDTAMNAGLIHSPPDPSQHGPDDFEKRGAFTINQREQHVDELERELRALMSSEEVREEIKAKKAKIDTEDEAYVPIIDVPERIMKELIKGRPEVGSAVESLFMSDISTPSGKDTALKKFRGIFSDTEPALDVLEKLRKYGIKNWEQFKKLWDTKFAEKALDTMHEMAKAMLKKEVSQNIGFLEKIVKFKGQIATRGILNGVLVGGSAYALTLVLSGGVSGIILAALGGMTGGAIKGKLFEWFGKKFGDRNKELQKELEESTKKKKNVVGRLVKNVMVGIDGGTLNEKDMIKMGEMPSFAAILAQSLRDTTTEANKMAKTEPEDVKKLEGNARVLYEEILSHIDTEEPGEKIKNQLAQAILKMNGKGDMKAHLLTEKLDSKIKGAIDKAFGAFGGHEGWKKGALAGGLVGAAFFAYQDVARAGFGGALGAWAGFKEGSKWDTKAEQKKAREQAFEDIHALREFAKTGVAGTDAERAVLRERLMRLKRLLHVSPGASQSELAVYGIVGREVISEKKESHGHGGGHHGHGGHGHGHGGHKKPSHKKDVGGWVDYAGNVVIDKNGNMVDPELKFLFQDMRAAVNDAEHEGLLQDKEEDRQKLDIVLSQLGKRGKDIEDKVKKRGILAMFGKGWEWLKKHKYGIGGIIVGGALGATVAYGGRELLKGELPKGLSSEPLPPHDSLPRRPSMGDLRGGAAPTAIAGSAGARALESTMSPDTTLSRTSGSSGAIPSEVVKPGTEIHEQRSMYSETSIIKKGEGVLHAVDRLIKDIDTGSLPELENLKGTALHNWKIAELKRMGFVFEKGKWGYPFTVHKGAQVELYTEIVDGDTVPHLRVIGDEGKEITMHKYHRFKGEVESATAGVSPERQAQIEAAKNNVAQFSKELHASTEVGSQTAPSVLPDQEIKDRLRVGGKLPGILDAEPAFDGRAVRLTLEGGEHAYVYPHHDAELRLGTDSNQDRFFWRLKSMEHSPAFILPGEATVTTGGAGKMVDSDTLVDRSAIAENKSVMSKEEYTKYRGALQSQTREEVVRVEKKPVVVEEKMEASEKNGTDINEPEVEPSISEKQIKFVKEIDSKLEEVNSRIKNLGGIDTEERGRLSMATKEILGVEKEMIMVGGANADIFNTEEDFYEQKIQPRLSAEMRLLMEDNTALFNSIESPKVGIVTMENPEVSADVPAVFETPDADGELGSSMLVKIGETEYLYDAPKGYTFGKDSTGHIILIDQAKQAYTFKITNNGFEIIDRETGISRQAQK